MDDALRIDELICDRSGENRWTFEEIKKQKCMHAIICDCVGIIVNKNNFLNSVPFLKS